ncbi:MAG: flagellar biosynthesis protein FlhF [Clostridia bacterium]|nr:MAG: flagellar biosynthesis protein FlhF [Clostridia bacterium]
MRVKRYLVSAMPEAIEAIRRDLGPDAMIVSSRRVRQNSPLGWLLPKKLEVTAAVDTPLPASAGGEPSREYQKLQEELLQLKNIISTKLLGESDQGLPATVAKWKNILEQLEVNQEIIDEVLQKVASHTGLEQEIAPQAVVYELADILGFPEGGCQLSSQVATFLGPTGVGKTTTLAKVAAHMLLGEKKKVALVTTDTYRIGATEQLKTYAEILGVPVEVVMTPRELRQAVDRHRDRDAVLIDTAGRSPRNPIYRQELLSYLASAQPGETFLVLSCTTKNRDLLRIAESYQEFNVNKLIFTKLDETTSLGPILNVVRATGLPVAYLSNGQNVPDDLLVASPRELARLIVEAGQP